MNDDESNGALVDRASSVVDADDQAHDDDDDDVDDSANDVDGSDKVRCLCFVFFLFVECIVSSTRCFRRVHLSHFEP